MVPLTRTRGHNLYLLLKSHTSFPTKSFFNWIQYGFALDYERMYLPCVISEIARISLFSEICPVATRLHVPFIPCGLKFIWQYEAD